MLRMVRRGVPHETDFMAWNYPGGGPEASAPVLTRKNEVCLVGVLAQWHIPTTPKSGIGLECLGKALIS